MTKRLTLFTVVVVAAAALLGGGCAATVDVPGSAAIRVDTDYYSPLRYNGHIVYYLHDRPIYYVNGKLRFIPSSHPRYHLYMTHYRTYRRDYRRWYRNRGVRIRRARRKARRLRARRAKRRRMKHRRKHMKRRRNARKHPHHNRKPRRLRGYQEDR